MRFDLVDLRLFIHIVEAGSISKGAEASHMALASASTRVSGMERSLGVPLLERGRRGVTPTVAGRSLLHHARTVTGQIERMRGDLRAFSSGLKGEIRMLSNSAALVEILPSALQIFLATHPNVDIDIEERTSIDIVLAVAAGRAEFGIVADSADLGQLQTRRLGVDRLTVVVAASHPLADRHEVDFAELLDEPFVGLAGGALHDHLMHHAARLGRRISYRVRLQSFEAVARLATAGIGVAILPMAAVEAHDCSGLSSVRLTDDWANRRLLVCAANFSELSTHARLLVDELERQAQHSAFADHQP